MTKPSGEQPTQPSDRKFAFVRADVRYRQGGLLRKAAYIEAADGLVRVRTEHGVQVIAPIAALGRVRGSWWRPGGFRFEVDGKRHKLAASLRGGPGSDSSGWFTDIDVLDMILLAVYVVASPLMAVYLIRTKRRWIKILRGRLDPAEVARQARARKREQRQAPEQAPAS